MTSSLRKEQKCTISQGPFNLEAPSHNAVLDSQPIYSRGGELMGRSFALSMTVGATGYGGHARSSQYQDAVSDLKRIESRCRAACRIQNSYEKHEPVGVFLRLKAPLLLVEPFYSFLLDTSDALEELGFELSVVVDSGNFISGQNYRALRRTMFVLTHYGVGFILENPAQKPSFSLAITMLKRAVSALPVRFYVAEHTAYDVFM